MKKEGEFIISSEEEEGQTFREESSESKENKESVAVQEIKEELEHSAVVVNDKPPILIIGGTGEVGANLALEARNSGKFEVYVTARDKGTKWEDKAEGRMHRLFEYLDPNYQGPNSDLGLKILNAELTLENLGFSDKQFEQVKNINFKHIINAGGHVLFTEGEADRNIEINYHGVRHLLDVVYKLASPEFPHLHQISTAFCGQFSEELEDGTLIIPEEFIVHKIDTHGEFPNPYAKSKYKAEMHLQSAPENVPITIYRPSIVTGRSDNYKTISKMGYYAFWKAFLLMKHWLLRELKDELKSQEYDRYNIRYDTEEGKLHLPIFVPGKKEATLNLVPIDWVVKTILELSQMKRAKEITPSGQHPTFNITHDNPPSYGEALEAGLELIGIKDVVIDENPIMDFLLRYHKARGQIADSELTPPQRVMSKFFDRILEYREFISKKRKFDTSYKNGKKVASHLPDAPPIDKKYLQEAIKHAFNLEINH